MHRRRPLLCAALWLVAGCSSGDDLGTEQATGTASDAASTDDAGDAAMGTRDAGTADTADGDGADGSGRGTAGDATGETSTGATVVSWIPDPVDLGEEFVLRGVWGADPDQVVAVGNKATIIEYTDGAWEVVHQNTELDTLNAVWGTSMNNVWAVGAQGAILHRDSSGWNIGTGCTSSASCDDGDTCTVDACSADGKCVYTGTGSPGCCGAASMQQDWESGQIFPWFVADISAAQTGMVWNVAALTAPGTGEPRATSGVYSLYFGDPAQHDFDNGEIVASTATSGPLSVPPAMEATVSFQVFIDTESSSSWDKLELRVLSGGVESTIWTKEDVGGVTGGVFAPATADLTPWVGQTIQLRFFFDSADPFANGGEGVFVDDVVVSTVCGTATGLRFPTLWDVWGTGADNVYAVGNEGTIIHFDGTSWKRQAGGEANDLFAVGGNAQAVAAGGAEGEVFTSLAGGLSVDKAATSAAIRAMVLQDGTEAIAAGDGGTIVRYVSGQWLEESTPTSADLHDAWTDGLDTVVVGANGTVLRQQGAGPWTLEPTGQSGVLYGVWGASSGHLLAVGDKGLLLEWDGAVWAKQGNLTNAELRSLIGFSDEGTVFAVGGGGTIVSRKAGVWAAEKSPTTYVLHGIWGAGEGDVWAVGNLGTMVRWNGSAWSVYESPTALTLHDVWGRAANDAYAVGASGVMLQWDGAEWTVLRSNTSANLRAVWGLAENDVFAVGAQATVMHFNGLNWSQIKVADEVFTDGTQPVVDQLFDVWGSAANDVWAVGAEGTLIHTEIEQTTGAVQWVKIPQQDNDVTVRGIAGQDADNLWLVGREGLVLHFEPPKLTPEETGSIATLYDVVRFPGGEVIAVGNLATILRRGVFAQR